VVSGSVASMVAAPRPWNEIVLLGRELQYLHWKSSKYIDLPAAEVPIKLPEYNTLIVDRDEVSCN
jgi:hypothetical protein